MAAPRRMCGAAAGDRDGPGSRFTAVIFDMDGVSPTPRGCTPRHGRTCSTRSCPHWAKAWRRRPGGGLPALRRWPLPRRRGTRGAVRARPGTAAGCTGRPAAAAHRARACRPKAGAVRRPAGRRRGAGLPVHGHAAAPAPRWRGTHQAGHGQPQQRRRVVGGGGAGPARRARRRRRRVMRIGTPPGAPPGSPRSGWCPRTVVTSPYCGPRSRRRTGPGRCACGPQWMGRVVNAGVAELCDTVERLGYRLDKEAVRRTVAFLPGPHQPRLDTGPSGLRLGDRPRRPHPLLDAVHPGPRQRPRRHPGRHHPRRHPPRRHGRHRGHAAALLHRPRDPRRPTLATPHPATRARPRRVRHEGRFHPTGSARAPVTWHTLARYGIACRSPQPAELDIRADPHRLAAWTDNNLDAY